MSERRTVVVLDHHNHNNTNKVSSRLRRIPTGGGALRFAWLLLVSRYRYRPPAPIAWILWLSLRQQQQQPGTVAATASSGVVVVSGGGVRAAILSQGVGLVHATRQPPSTTCVPQQSWPAAALFQCRGGDAVELPPSSDHNNNADDEELDAYIENLISSVAETSTAKSTAAPIIDDDDKVETDDDSASDVGEAEVDPSFSIVTENEKTHEPPSEIRDQTVDYKELDDEKENAVPSSERDDSNVGHAAKWAHAAVEKDAEQRRPTGTNVAEDEITIGDSGWNSSLPQKSAVPRRTFPAVHTTSSSLRPNAPPPPNAVYRFLLRQGPVGHVLVVVLVVLVEWLTLYVPQLTQLWAWLVSLVLPGAGEPSLRPGSCVDDVATVATTTSGQGRTGQSRKRARALTRQADQVAMQQLKMLGNVQEAKYRHVSLDFMKRHKLGPFHSSTSTVAAIDDNYKMGEKEPRKTHRKSKAAKNNEVVSVDDDEDVDWVVQALTKVKPQSKKPLIQPTVSIGIGPQGPAFSVGVEFGGSGRRPTDRHKAIVQAVTSDTRKRRKTTAGTTQGPRLSDRDGGDGIFGRLRAAAGTDSMLSRNLLGAYPGDAVPPSEAASPDGVTALARKYGWGDWPDDDDEMDDSIVRTRVKTRRRKKRRSTDNVDLRRRSTLGINFEVGSGCLPSIENLTSRSIERRQNNPDILLPKPAVLTKNLASRATSAKSVRMIRPAMELLDGFGVRDEKISALNERRRSQPDPPLVKSTAIGMNGSRTNTVKMIRPALEQLQERQRQLQAMKRHDEDSS